MSKENNSNSVFASCRLCLKSAKPCERIVKNDTLLDKIANLLKLKIDNSDQYSQIICKSCKNLIEHFWDYYQNVQNNQLILHNSTSIKPSLDKPEITEKQRVEQRKRNLRNFALKRLPPVNVNDPNLSTLVEPPLSEDYTAANIIHEVGIRKRKLRNTHDQVKKQLPDKINDQLIEDPHKSDVHDNDKLVVAKTPASPKSQNSIEFIKKRISNMVNDQLPEHLKIRSTTRTCDAKIKEFIKLNCSICCVGTPSSMEFDNFKALQDHYASVHNCRGFVMCCEKKIYRKDRLIDHLINHTDPNAFKCPQCGLNSKNKCLLKIHMKQHLPVDERPFQCDSCSRRFVQKSHLTNHLATHLTDAQKKFACDECGKMFALKFVMANHKLRHKKERNYVCDICARSFAVKCNLDSHLAHHHHATSGGDLSQRRVQCNLCQSWYKNLGTLRTHMAQHRDKREHRCDTCQKLCSTKSALVTHVRYVHLKVKNFGCTECDRKFRRKLQLREHMARHSGQALYTCEFCAKTFAFNSNYYAHRKMCHKSRGANNQVDDLSGVVDVADGEQNKPDSCQNSVNDKQTISYIVVRNIKSGNMEIVSAKK